MVSEANAVHNWLRTTWKVSVPDDWLQACIEWIHSENDGVHATVSQLCNLVFEQWLVCDLREIGASCLPPGLSQHTKHVLNGTYALQLNSTADVGTSFYSQLQKVKGTENSNTSVSATQATQPAWEPKPSRMLMMKFTDGTQDIQAMEYQPIPTLNSTLTPGTKIVILGSVLCRSGVLMLKSENIRVLGGEVESLVEENTTEKILSTSLQHNIDLNVGPNDLPRKAFEVDRQTSHVNMPSSSGSQLKSERNSVVESSWPITVASERNNNNSNRRVLEDVEEIPDDDLVTMATSLDEMNTDQVQWGEEDFDLATAAEMMDCDFEDCDTRTPFNSSSVMKTNSSAVNKRLSCTENSRMVQTNVAKKPKMERDDLVANGVVDLVDDVDFDDDDFDWETSLGSVCQTKRKEMTPARKIDENLSMERTTLSSKLCKKASLTTGQQRKREIGRTQENNSSGSALGFADRVGLRSVVSLTDDDTSCSTSGYHSQIETTSRLVTPPQVTAKPQPISRLVTLEESDVDQRRRPVSDRASRCSDVVPFAYLSQVMTRPYPQVFNVKAYISTLVGRLEHNQGSHWSLVVKINDGSAAVDVLLTDEKMRQRAKVDKSIKQKLAEGIQRCQETLVQLSSIMELELSADLSMPSVRSFRSVTESDIESLRQRIEFSKSSND